MDDYCDRNLLWQSADFQKKLENARIVIGGMGGLGWCVGSSLIGLGARNISVFDADSFELANLNRLWGCSRKDIGTPKVSLFQKLAQGVDSSITIDVIEENIPSPAFEEAIRCADVVFGCYDTPEPRLSTQIFSLRQDTTYIDIGTSISLDNVGFEGFGQVFVNQNQDSPCIVCCGLRQSELNYQGDGGGAEPSSGVLNSLLSNLGVCLWIQLLQGQTVPIVTQFEWNKIAIEKYENLERRPGCPICGPQPDWKS